MALLEIKNLSFQVDTTKILDDFSLSVEAGEVHALLGTNGTGKSTLAYLIAGCEGYRPTSGTILFAGKAIQTSKIHERAQLGITMAWQEPVRFEGISVAQYLTLKQRDLDPAPYLAMVGLEPGRYLARMVDRSLSGGERKRIELASILALHPRLAIFDEPDSGIDMLSIQDIINVIAACKEHGSAVLLITHREEIALIADQASQICRGKVVCSGTPAEVAAYYKSRQCSGCATEVCVDERP
ncbi:ABC transporter ATP-binding protein [Thiovibrio frasassiensis]|uniref:ABC transporter ATP-binding protein n=1 Tax=Thiovibrio frasassiensis TaxID=2984131 RepID=A0A9X4MI03_9BACT|nr:ABC transporter ATP-binding protein [Thiovibrio frasassiensis]MDG4476982.1 ABC transporter ATP-binding protein [Thiovibrio frasassiensis]